MRDGREKNKSPKEQPPKEPKKPFVRKDLPSDLKKGLDRIEQEDRDRRNQNGGKR